MKLFQKISRIISFKAQPRKYLVAMLTKGANIGKKVDRNIISHCSIDFMGSILRSIPLALVSNPINPTKKSTIFRRIPKIALGMPVMIFFPRFFILCHKLFCS